MSMRERELNMGECRQEKEVEEDSVEGQAWLESEKRKKDVKGKGVRSAEDDLFGPEEPQEEKVGEMVVVVEKPKAAPPRRAKGGLAGMAAGLGKPPKLNTLEKSKLDWNKWVSVSLSADRVMY